LARHHFALTLESGQYLFFFSIGLMNFLDRFPVTAVHNALIATTRTTLRKQLSLKKEYRPLCGNDMTIFS